MNLSELKQSLNVAGNLTFLLPDGNRVPAHFHVTEVGLVTKHFIDCGGTIRDQKTANIQIWTANDTEHRLSPEKFLKIIKTFEKLLGDNDPEIEIEYQKDTIGKYGVTFDGSNFILTATHTACLASDNCGTKPRVALQELSSSSCCTPGSGCC